MKTLDLTGETAIVTGGGTGIGRAVSQDLAKLGVNVIVCGRRSQPLERVSVAIRKQGDSCQAITADISKEDDVERLIEKTVDLYGGVHILVNNAGIEGSGRIHEHDVTTWDRVMAVNLRGPFLTARAVLPWMRSQGRGHIINISSESGLEYYEGNGAYGVAKHALNALGEFMQRENQEYGVRIDTVCPGMVVTPMSEGSPGLKTEKCLYPGDIADLTVWLLTRRPNVKIGRPILIQTMENPWR